MRWHALLLVLSGAAAHAEDAITPALYDQHFRVRFLTGAGADAHGTAFGAIAAELGQSPFRGALSSGAGIASATAFNGAWTVFTPYVFGRLDLAYLILTHFWSREPSPFPFRLHAGFRFGLDVSESFRTGIPTVETSYVLARPSAQIFGDAEWALDQNREFFVALRVGSDFPLVFETVFRTSATIGLVYCWGGKD